MRISPISVNQKNNQHKNTNFSGTLRVNCLTNTPNGFYRYRARSSIHSLDTNRILEIYDATKYSNLPIVHIVYQLGNSQFPNIIKKRAIAKIEDLTKCWEYAKPNGRIVDYIMNDDSILEKITEDALKL